MTTPMVQGRSQPAWLLEGAAAFVARYDGLRGRLPGDTARREAGAEAFRRRGLPGMRDEEWRYTSLRPLAETRFAEALTPLAEEDADLLARLPSLDVPRLVFVDGRFRDDLSVVPDHVAVRVGGPAYAGAARPEREQLVALNTMLAEDGAAIEVAAGTDGGTLLLASIGSGPAARPVAFHPRHAVRLGAGAALTLLEVAVGSGTYLHNPVLEVLLADCARLTHLRLQDESRTAFSLATLYAEVGAHATYDSFSLVLGGRLARMEVHAHLAGDGATAHLNAAQLLADTQHGDFTTVVRHNAVGCTSRQTVKNVLTGHARGVFQGKIEVARGAQKTDGYQMNQALLLSPDAEVSSKPQLEIFADDVKCSHGATIGELDPEQMFYLRSRGIAEADARAMLVRAFLTEALDPIAHEAGRVMLEAAVARWWERQAA
jgi:Fe-S cluster assembly protein SufD